MFSKRYDTKLQKQLFADNILQQTRYENSNFIPDLATIVTETNDTNPLNNKYQGSLRGKNCRNIMIFGDDQLLGLSTKLRSTRLNIKDDIYKVLSFIKPNARCSQILNSCDNVINDLSENDVVIIGVGSNDKNPFLVISELCKALTKLKKNKVFVVGIASNSYLNENYLNHNFSSAATKNF